MSFFKVACGEAGIGVKAGNSHEVSVRANSTDVLDGGRADSDDGVLEELSSDKDDFDAGMLYKLDRNCWAVRDDGGFEIRSKVARDLNRGCSAIEYYNLAGTNHCSCGSADGFFLVCRDVEPECEVAHCRGGRKSTAVYALEQSFCCELAQIAADGVFGDIEFVAEVFGDDRAGFAKGFEKVFTAMAGEHSCTIAQNRVRCTKMHEFARLCTIEISWFRGGRMNVTKPLIVLVAGPYRSGTDGDPAKILRNLQRLERHAFGVFNAGHIPLIGEWVALPLAAQAGSSEVGDAISEQYLYPVAGRLLERCDAVLRIEGTSKGADEDVRIARERGLPVYFDLKDVPKVAATA